MKKAIIKTLSVMLAVVLTFTAAPLSGFVGLELPDWLDFSIKSSAAETSGTCGENLTWTFDESTGVLTISGIGEMKNYGYNNFPWKNYGDSIKEVVIESGVTTIGEYAFYYYRSLKSITIDDSIRTIGGFAFEGCDSLDSVTIPNGVTTIGDFAFSDCTSLDSVIIGDSVKLLVMLHF